MNCMMMYTSLRTADQDTRVPASPLWADAHAPQSQSAHRSRWSGLRLLPIGVLDCSGTAWLRISAICICMVHSCSISLQDCGLASASPSKLKGICRRWLPPSFREAGAAEELPPGCLADRPRPGRMISYLVLIFRLLLARPLIFV